MNVQVKRRTINVKFRHFNFQLKEDQNKFGGPTLSSEDDR